MSVARVNNNAARTVTTRTALVLAGFLVYGGVCALIPLRGDQPLTEAPARAWRSAGCQSCHSVLGLGGHIGPDLTNIASRASPGHVRAVVRAGFPGMPGYDRLKERTLDAIVVYLQEVDGLGRYPPSDLKLPFGVVE